MVLARLNPCQCGDVPANDMIDLEILTLSESELLKEIASATKDQNLSALFTSQMVQTLEKGDREQFMSLNISWEDHLELARQISIKSHHRPWERVALSLGGDQSVESQESESRAINPLWQTLYRRWSEHPDGYLFLLLNTHELYTLSNGHRLRRVSLKSVVGAERTLRRRPTTDLP